MLKLPMIFTDKMVLQREKPIHIWGESDSNAVINIEFDNKKNTTIADANGKWNIILPAMQSATNLTLIISDGKTNHVLKDICVGEVWLAGGQSNMEFLLGFEEHFDEIVKTERNPMIRFFDYPEVAYEGEYEDRNYIHEGFWRSCTENDLAYFSAVGYYFARSLQESLQIPVGIIGCNWGGTPACAWMNPNYLKGTEGEIWLKEYAEVSTNLNMELFLQEYKSNPINDRTNQLNEPIMSKLLKNGLTREEQIEFKTKMADAADYPSNQPLFYERRPGGLYETMLKKIVPYSIRGVIWYQGETDGDSHATEYTTVFSQLIKNWRDLWGEEIPFLFTQLAPFEEWMHVVGKDYGIVRECQETVSKNVPMTWMATSGDVGMRWDIHPKNKKPIGERLALLARGHVYDEKILCDAPEIISAVKDNGNIILTFNHGEGLNVEGEAINSLILLDQNGQKVNYQNFKTHENQLILLGAWNTHEIQFAKENYYKVNLYNGSHIPAKPFILNIG